MVLLFASIVVALVFDFLIDELNRTLARWRAIFKPRYGSSDHRERRTLALSP